MGTLLIVGVFRRLSPLLFNLLALVVGIAMAFAGTFLVFGEIHVAALLFGTSLIGVAVDYGLHTAPPRSAARRQPENNGWPMSCPPSRWGSSPP